MPLEANDGRPQPPPKPTSGVQIPCPRCDSTNTKFCYYNNYNLSQPRHFCKSCRRYWTHGGALRNVPVGGGTRKSSASKRQRSALSSSAPSAAPSHSPPSCSTTLTPFEPDSSPALASSRTMGSMCGSGLDGDAAMLNTESSGPYGGRGFGYALGLYDTGAGNIWPCSTTSSGANYYGVGSNSGGGGGMHNTWQFLSDLGLGGGGAGGGDSFAWPGLAISSPWDGSSK